MAEAERARGLRPGVAPENTVTAQVAATAGFGALGSREEVWLMPRTIARFRELPAPAAGDRLAAAEPEGTSGDQERPVGLFLLADEISTPAARAPCFSR